MRIAVAQMPGGRLDRWRETLTLIDELVQQAAGLHADVVLLPECAWPVYCIGSREAYWAARADGLPGPGEFVAHMQALARTRALTICGGYIDEDGDRLLNAACVIDADGTLRGVRQKCFLWAFDRCWFETGRQIEPVDANCGRVGVLICADARLPEIPATLAARGARLCLQPTAWVEVGEAGEFWNPQPAFLIAARAGEFGIPFASASKWGREEDTTFVGQSLICDGDGAIVAQCGPQETRVIVAEVEPRVPRPPSVTEDERAALLAKGAYVLPKADVSDLELCLETSGAAHDDDGHAPRLYVCRPTAADVRDPASVDGLRAIVRGPAAELIELAGVYIAAVAAADANRFAGIRKWVLQGVHVVVVCGDAASLTQVRARACENRIFIVWCRAGGVVVVDPSGQPGVEEPWPTAGAAARVVAPLPVRRAADKEFAWHTHLLADRRPADYAF